MGGLGGKLECLSELEDNECDIFVGTNLIHDITAATFSVKLAFFREKRPFPCFREIRDFS